MEQEIEEKKSGFCEDCKLKIKPTYDSDTGFVSPESTEVRLTHVMGHPAVEAIAKVVCLDCYLLAFARKYPGEKLPKLAAYK